MENRPFDKFRENIKEEPMNRERFDYVIRYKMNGMIFSKDIKNSIVFKDIFRIFYVNPDDNIEKQIKKFLHAVGHAYRDISIFEKDKGVRKDAGKIESLINTDMGQYYRKDKNHVRMEFKKTKKAILENKIAYF